MLASVVSNVAHLCLFCPQAIPLRSGFRERRSHRLRPAITRCLRAIIIVAIDANLTVKSMVYRWRNATIRATAQGWGGGDSGNGTVPDYVDHAGICHCRTPICCLDCPIVSHGPQAQKYPQKACVSHGAGYCCEMIIRFVIPGRVGGKGRPRFVRATGRAFTPSKTVSMEATVRHFAAEAMKRRSPLLGPIRLTVEVRINHPASWSKRRKADTVFVTGKPDADNIIKLLGDAANGIVWRDDAQIAQIEFNRRYSTGPEYTAVTVYDLTVPPFNRTDT